MKMENNTTKDHPKADGVKPTNDQVATASTSNNNDGGTSGAGDTNPAVDKPSPDRD
jgi:hypothetical protein